MKNHTLLLVLLIAILVAPVYAQNFNVNAGVGYAYKSFAMEENDESGSMGFNAFQAQIGAGYTFENNVFVYGDFSMAFPSKMFSKSDGIKETMSKTQISNMIINVFQASSGYDWSIDKVSLLGYDFSVGCGYCIQPNRNFAIKLGGGFRYDAGMMKFKDLTVVNTPSVSVTEKMIFSTIGLEVQAEGIYFISDNIGVMLSLKQNTGLHTFMKVKADGGSSVMNVNMTQDKDYSKSSLTFNATAGVVFAF